MTETRFFEPARLSTPAKPLFSLKPLDANLVEVIVIQGLPEKLRENRVGAEEGQYSPPRHFL